VDRLPAWPLPCRSGKPAVGANEAATARLGHCPGLVVWPMVERFSACGRTCGRRCAVVQCRQSRISAAPGAQRERNPRAPCWPQRPAPTLTRRRPSERLTNLRTSDATQHLRRRSGPRRPARRMGACGTPLPAGRCASYESVDGIGSLGASSAQK
jgi:hypothetical protein